MVPFFSFQMVQRFSVPYLPFIVLSKARNWSQSRTLWITFISGFGHVAGSVILGLVGIALGLSVSKLENIESGRGGLVGWMLLAFGILYMAYGLYKYLKKAAAVIAISKAINCLKVISSFHNTAQQKVNKIGNTRHIFTGFG